MDILGVNTLTTATGVVTESSTVKGLPVSNIAVAGAVTVYTRAVYVGAGKFFSLSYIANSVLGGIDLKIEIQQSFRLPVTEGAADTYWAKPDGMGDVVASLTVENTLRIYSLPLVPAGYFRLKITGAAGNSADCLLNAWFSKQELA
jgi:hypothetical protein